MDGHGLGARGHAAPASHARPPEPPRRRHDSRPVVRALRRAARPSHGAQHLWEMPAAARGTCRFSVSGSRDHVGIDTRCPFSSEPRTCRGALSHARPYAKPEVPRPGRDQSGSGTTCAHGTVHVALWSRPIRHTIHSRRGSYETGYLTSWPTGAKLPDSTEMECYYCALVRHPPRWIGRGGRRLGPVLVAYQRRLLGQLPSYVPRPRPGIHPHEYDHTNLPAAPCRAVPCADAPCMPAPSSTLHTSASLQRAPGLHSCAHVNIPI